MNRINKAHFSIFILIFLTVLLSAKEHQLFVKYRQMETEHFQIIYEPMDKKSADEVYSFCEEVYSNVTNLLDSYPDKIKVVLHGRIDQANGNYYPIPEHLNLYITTPINFFNGALTESWLKSLLTHELTHYIHISYEKGWIYELSKFLGPSVKAAPGALFPGWMLEGFTTNTETMFSQGGRGRNPLFEMSYKTHILEGNLFTLKQAGYSSDFPPYSRIYISGYIFINYLIRSYGEDVLKTIHSQMIRNPLSPKKALLRATGKTADQLWDEMRLELIQKYKANFDIPEGEQISPYQIGDWHLPRITDKGFITYQQVMKKNPGLYLFDPVTGENQLLAKTYLTDRWSYTASSSGEKVFFSAFDIDAAAPGGATYHSDIFQIRYGKRKSKRITKDKHLWHPSLSGDGKRLIAVQKRDSYSNLVEVFPETGEVQTLFSMEQATVFTPALSSDGKKILFVLNIRGKQDIWLLDENGARPLTGFNGGSEYYPRFIDDQTIWYSGDKSGELVLYKIELPTNDSRNPEDLLATENAQWNDFFTEIPILRDKVGILAATEYQGKILFETYRSRGSTLFTTSPKQLSYFEKVSLPLLTQSATLTPSGLEAPVTATQYTLNDYPAPFEFAGGEEKWFGDIPRFLGWAPVPFYYSEVESAEAPWGIGAAIFAQSLNKETFVQAIVSFPFTQFQPAVYLDVSFPIGRLNLTYDLNHQYGSYGKAVDGDVVKQYAQSSYQQLNINIPLYYHQVAGRTLSFAANTGLVHRFRMEKEEPFHLFDSGDGVLSDFITYHTLDQYNGVRFYYGETSSRASIYPEVQVYSSLGMQTALATLSRTEQIINGSMDFGFSAPLAPGHNLFASITAGYSDSQNTQYSFAPRGFASQSVSARGKGMATLGYNFNIANFDLPLFSGFSFQGLAAAVYFQTQFWYDFTADASQIDNYLYAGVEFMPILGFSEGTFPITAGVNFRFDLSFQNAFNSSTDISPYFSINMDFISSFRDRKASWEPKDSQKRKFLLE